MNPESTIFGVSARGILAFIVTISCCILAVWIKDIGVLKDLAFLALGSYFSQKSQPSQSITTGGDPNATTTITSTPVSTTVTAEPSKS